MQSCSSGATRILLRFVYGPLVAVSLVFAPDALRALWSAARGIRADAVPEIRAEPKDGLPVNEQSGGV